MNEWINEWINAERGLCCGKMSAFRTPVRPSVCLSVTRRYSIETAKYTIKASSHRVVPPFVFFRIKRGGNIPTGASNARRYEISNCCGREAARCFVFVCSQLQHTYSAVFLLPVTAASDLLVHKILLWLGYPMVKKFWRYLFVLTQLTNLTDTQTDRQTDRHRIQHRLRLCIPSRGKNDVPVL